MFSSLCPSCSPRCSSSQSSSSFTGQLGTPISALLPNTLLPKRVPMLRLLLICPKTWKLEPSLTLSPAATISQILLEEKTGLCSREWWQSTCSVFIILEGCSRGCNSLPPSSCFTSFLSMRRSFSDFSGLQAGEICSVESTRRLKSGYSWRMRKYKSWQTLFKVFGFIRLVRFEFFLAQFQKMDLKPGQILMASSRISSCLSLRKNLRQQVTSMRQRMRFLYSGWSLEMLTTSRTCSEFCVISLSLMSQLVSLIMQAKKMASISFMRKILATALSTLQTGNRKAMWQLRATERRMGMTERSQQREQVLQAWLYREGMQPFSCSSLIILLNNLWQ